jgi:hypothetical protein
VALNHVWAKRIDATKLSHTDQSNLTTLMEDKGLPAFSNYKAQPKMVEGLAILSSTTNAN